MRTISWAAAAALMVLAGGVEAAPVESVTHQVLRDLLAIDTTYEKGTVAAVDLLKARFLAAGFKADDLAVLANPNHLNQSNLIVRLRAKPGAAVKPVLYLCHLDVVAAKPEDWTLPPFQMTEKDGYIYGRGSLDMKSEDAAIVAALIRLKSEGYAPARDIIVAFSPDEEAGGAEGVGWLMGAVPELRQVGLVLNPDAGGGLFVGGVRTYYGFQTSEKVYVSFQAEVTNKGGHSSLPRPDNAIYSLAGGLTRLGAYRFPTRLTPTVKAYYATLAQFSSGQHKTDMELVGRGDLAAADRLSADPGDNAQVRTTCVATMLEGGHADNALPQRARATIQCRMLPGDTQAQIQAELARVMADPDIHLTPTIPATPSPESPPTPAITNTVTKVVHSMWPTLPITPSMDAGASDSKYPRNLGIPAYGVSAVFPDADDIRAHGRDERIVASRLEEAGELAYRFMKAFSGPGAP